MKILTTGGAGFIGTNFCLFAQSDGADVTALDNLSGQGSKKNLKLLKEAKIDFIKSDVTKPSNKKLGRFDAILHLAASASSPKSLKNPSQSFLTNVVGTLNVLEFARKTNTPLLLSSTIKVYDTDEINKSVVSDKSRYRLKGKRHVNEGLPTLDPGKSQQPLGVSKKIAETLVTSYCKNYSIPAVILRLSTVFGPHQHGSEELGWVSWFVKAKKESKPVNIYGDGKQVRDCLWVDDLSELLMDLISNLEKYSGTIYNVGGGFQNSMSLLELSEYLEKKDKIKMKLDFKAPRPNDFKVYVTDNSKVKKETGWQPKTSIFKGVDTLLEDL
jgi:CDP-paratose 2-epimerase